LGPRRAPRPARLAPSPSRLGAAWYSIESGTPRGPCQALRGPEGSMHETVDGMLEEFEKAGISLPLLPRLGFIP
jgi:hypothetical protein